MSFLLVYPNPYTELDADGYPAGAVPVDPDHDTARKWVGATPDTVKRPGQPAAPRPGDLSEHAWQPICDTRWRFDFSAPIWRPLTPYYAERVREGTLLAADAPSARRAGCTAFVPPADALRAGYDASRSEYRSRTGFDVPDRTAPAVLAPALYPTPESGDQTEVAA